MFLPPIRTFSRADVQRDVPLLEFGFFRTFKGNQVTIRSLDALRYGNPTLLNVFRCFNKASEEFPCCLVALLPCHFCRQTFHKSPSLSFIKFHNEILARLIGEHDRPMMSNCFGEVFHAELLECVCRHFRIPLYHHVMSVIFLTLILVILLLAFQFSHQNHSNIAGFQRDESYPSSHDDTQENVLDTGPKISEVVAVTTTTTTQPPEWDRHLYPT